MISVILIIIGIALGFMLAGYASIRIFEIIHDWLVEQEWSR